jgi:outer membrane lipoprotein-sorting protein
LFALSGDKALRRRLRIRHALLALLPMFATGCMSIKTTRDIKKEEIHVQMEAGEDQLIASYNEQARAVRTLQATVDLVPSTGSTYSGVIEDYHDVPGFILAKRPATVRVIGQAPVVAKNIFDMVSDGEMFRIFIPSKNTFLVGSTSLMRASKKPIENLRPQHVVDALFWPELPAGAHVLFEQFDADPKRYYILTLLREAAGGKLELARKIWFDRVDLRGCRVQLYGAAGRLDSDITYGDWQPFGAPPAGAAATTGSYAHDIHIWRPQDDYKLEIRILKLTVNEEITADRFELDQPTGTELVRVGEEQAVTQP